ncbi:hypothetical protein CVT24_005624 [Panaeolus cyanescens]|uniref:Uncharacterized protein n=1 Tax=Panaeolus cyanescens TaxID=181874 RepID=A0A409YY00_9AGAR|nr:hypothetical protein CVT24_005624 [Panaeolus cyanescens]
MRRSDVDAGLSWGNRSLSGYVGAFLFESFLYGMYFMTFGFCMYTLYVNRRTMLWPLGVAAVLMFAISTTDIIISVHMLLHYIIHGRSVPVGNSYPKYILFITNNVIADCLLLYRCYMVWSRSKRIVVVPALLLLASTVWGYISTISTSARDRERLSVYLWLTLGLNVAITAVTESGAIYSLYTLLCLTVNSVVLDVGLVQVVGLVPTLIIVQVGLGRSVQDIDSTVAMHRTERRSSSTPVLDTIFSSSGSRTAPNTAPHTPMDTNIQLPRNDQSTNPV